MLVEPRGPLALAPRAPSSGFFVGTRPRARLSAPRTRLADREDRRAERRKKRKFREADVRAATAASFASQGDFASQRLKRRCRATMAGHPPGVSVSSIDVVRVDSVSFLSLSVSLSLSLSFSLSFFFVSFIFVTSGNTRTTSAYLSTDSSSANTRTSRASIIHSAATSGPIR